MRARILKMLDDVRGSYWFIPSIMTVGAVLLALSAAGLDARLGTDWLESVPWLNASQPDGARSLLATVAASMIGIAGVSFSITIVAMIMAASQFGPRLLSNFMYDRGNQVTLGTFIGTFVYCVLVLRTVRSADTSAAITEATTFVPHFAVLLALVLALFSLGAFIYFIHHATESINVSLVCAEVGRAMISSIDTLYPEPVGDAGGDIGREQSWERFASDVTPVEVEVDGYVQTLDLEGLLGYAEDRDIFLRVLCRPGDFVSRGTPLVLVSPIARVDQTVRRTILGAFALGAQRTRAQDVLFDVDQLVEIAARALSPGVNDPRTAMVCLDWIGAGLRCLAGRAMPAAVRIDSEGVDRLESFPLTFCDLLERVFEGLRPYVAADRNATLHALQVLATLGSAVQSPVERSAIVAQIDAITAAAEGATRSSLDATSFQERADIARELTAGTRDPLRAATTLRWFGGSA